GGHRGLDDLEEALDVQGGGLPTAGVVEEDPLRHLGDGGPVAEGQQVPEGDHLDAQVAAGRDGVVVEGQAAGPLAVEVGERARRGEHQGPGRQRGVGGAVADDVVPVGGAGDLGGQQVVGGGVDGGQAEGAGPGCRLDAGGPHL